VSEWCRGWHHVQSVQCLTQDTASDTGQWQCMAVAVSVHVRPCAECVSEQGHLKWCVDQTRGCVGGAALVTVVCVCVCGGGGEGGSSTSRSC
jgi:hypothetical protein